MQLLIALLVLGVVQGIAEFLPISSSGHLVIFENIEIINNLINSVGDDMMLFINVFLHVATLIAVIIYFRKDIFEIARDFILSIIKKDFSNKNFKLAISIIIASVPAGAFGYLLKDDAEILFSSLLAVGIMLILNGFILLSTRFIKEGFLNLQNITFPKALLIGFFQAIAIIPGISRSGMTIAGGMLNGVKPNDAARFSFLMAIPVIAGAGLLKGFDVIEKGLPTDFILLFLIVMVVTILVALISIKVLFYFVRKIRIDIFGYYTIFAGTLCILASVLF